MDNLQTVWVEDGCICCHACVNALPSVFCFPHDQAEILASVRLDRKTSPNELERSGLNALGLSLSDDIIEAAAGCPVEVIKFIR
jgi:ferredoxin